MDHRVRRASNTGADNFGRVQFLSYFRPAGVAGAINIRPRRQRLRRPAIGYGTWNAARRTPWHGGDHLRTRRDQQPLPRLRVFKVPNSSRSPGCPSRQPARTPTCPYAGGMPIDRETPDPPSTAYPDVPVPTTHGQLVDADRRLVNEADEMNLYSPNPLLDSPYGPSDLEWLYRQQDVDGSTLTSRLSQLAPVSFTNTIDGQRRRRLFALR